MFNIEDQLKTTNNYLEALITQATALLFENEKTNVLLAALVLQHQKEDVLAQLAFLDKKQDQVIDSHNQRTQNKVNNARR